MNLKTVLDVLYAGQYYVYESHGNFKVDIKLNGALADEKDIKKHLNDTVNFWSFERSDEEDDYVDIILEN